ncbi:PKD domain-containing protein [Sanguibacter sp. HDW7]|uniref:PKD domain-containing protein n=1 Tax=Sanguibacter sp. HDW7 TaxID=2714931 RepID=UPI00140891D1|nr:PKD domain-containing protein [Sanguibacter sp. HDW7]QIK83216.1 PKD domain-containing protein [Sanguibacter sp. HDW7]
MAEPDLRAWCEAPTAFVCPEGSVVVTPMKYRVRPSGGTAEDWSGWRLLNGPCAREIEPVDDLAEAMARELRTLKIPAKRARIAPVTTWFTVQVPMTYFTDAGVEHMRTTVLGTEVELELTPTLFSWDSGDGCEPVTSREPGAAYPDRTVTHTYTTVGEYRVTLTTTWSGRFRVMGTDGWRPIDGTGSTTHSSARFETREVRSVLS